jgi:hypothetical protein
MMVRPREIIGSTEASSAGAWEVVRCHVVLNRRPTETKLGGGEEVVSAGRKRARSFVFS